jgi:hypothetical protein
MLQTQPESLGFRHITEFCLCECADVAAVHPAMRGHFGVRICGRRRRIFGERDDPAWFILLKQ